jgi:hypothetical protein
MTRVLVASVVVLLALAAAAATLALAPGQAIAVFGAVVAVLGLGLNVYRDLMDRGSLNVEVGITRQAPAGKRDLDVRLYNSGRRPVRVEDVGFWAKRSPDAIGFPMWSWGNNYASQFPATLNESDSKKVRAFSISVATWYARYPAPEWLFVKPLDGQLRWWRLPKDVRGELALAWPEAQAAHRRDEEEEARNPGELDGYYQPKRPSGRVAD